MNIKHIEEISKKILNIRKAMGYASQDEEWESEYKSTLELIGHAKRLKYECVESGGFRYECQKSGNIKITPAFSWIVKK